MNPPPHYLNLNVAKGIASGGEWLVLVAFVFMAVYLWFDPKLAGERKGDRLMVRILIIMGLLGWILLVTV